MVGPVVFSFAMAMTVPVIQIHFMQLIDSNILAISEMLKVGIMAVVNTSVTKEKFLTLYDRHFKFIVVSDILALIEKCRPWIHDKQAEDIKFEGVRKQLRALGITEPGEMVLTMEY